MLETRHLRANRIANGWKIPRLRFFNHLRNCRRLHLVSYFFPARPNHVLAAASDTGLALIGIVMLLYHVF